MLLPLLQLLILPEAVHSRSPQQRNGNQAEPSTVCPEVTYQLLGLKGVLVGDGIAGFSWIGTDRDGGKDSGWTPKGLLWLGRNGGAEYSRDFP